MTAIKKGTGYTYSSPIAFTEAQVLVGNTEYSLLGQVISTKGVEESKTNAVYNRLRKKRMGRPLGLGNQLLYPKWRIEAAIDEVLAEMKEAEEAKVAPKTSSADLLMAKLEKNPELAKVLLDLVS